MKRYLFFLAFVFGASSLAGQDYEVDFTEYKLDNGLHVILHQDNSTPIVAVSVLYHVGSKNENPERTGFAHFFEHLMFEGSENVDRGEFDKYINGSGGTNNAFTTQDMTFYYEMLPSNQLALGLWLESERMLHAKVDQVGIETQREVVKEERRQRIDNQPYGSIQEEILKRAYKEHPYQWAPIGSMEHLNAAQEEDYKQFYEDFYVPNNAVLSIAGDIDLEETKALVTKYFADIPPSSKPVYRPDIVEPPLDGEVIDTVYDNIQLPAVIQTYRIPAQGTEEYYAVSMLGTLLSGGESSRMYKALVDEKKIALQVASLPFPLEDPSIYVALGICNMGVSPGDVNEAINEEIERVQNELISDKEFQKLRNQTETQFISANSSVLGIAQSLATYHVFFGDANLINTEIDRYMNVTKEDIRDAARKYLVPDNRITLTYLPNPADKS